MSTLADLKRLMLKKQIIKSEFNKLQTFGSQSAADVCPNEIKNRIDEMHKIANEFEKVTIDIVCCQDTSESEKGAESNSSEADLLELDSFKTSWYTVLSQLQAKLESFTPAAPTSPVSSISNAIFQTPSQLNVRLPVIALPFFSGKHTEWLPFFDGFQSLIHNNHALDDCQKFHYLKSCLKGEAAHAIESLSISSENYRSAWAVLQKRYKNTRLIIQGHVQAILNSPEINKSSAESLRKLVDDIINNLEALKVLKLPIDTWDAMVVTIIMNKLDYQTRREFENTLDSDPLTLKQVTDFLEKKLVILESLNQNSKPKQTDNKYQANSISKRSAPNFFNRTANAATSSRLSCYFCKKTHYISQCEEFLRLNIAERKNEIKKRNLCQNCLRGNHKLTECKASGCLTCQSRQHHTLLHESRTADQTQPRPSANHCSSSSQKTHVVLSTAIVLIKDSSGQFKECRSLLDVGSQVNILSESMCKRLGLKAKKTNVSISGINDTYNNTIQTAKITLRSLHQPYETDLECCILKNVTVNLPTESFDKNALQIPAKINLADPKFNENGPIDLLLGAETFWKLLCVGRIKLSSPDLYLTKTLFGWIVGGAFIEERESVVTCNVAIKESHYDDLNNSLERFWAQEEVLPTKNNWSAEEIECEEQFMNTYRRDPNDGRFIIKLPFKSNKINLGDSSRSAMKRFISLEKKFRKCSDLKNVYCKEISELIESGYLKEVPPKESSSENLFYLPHSGVFKRDQINPKIRIVYDGSSKSSNGLSLNDNLHTGPNLQNDPFAILIRFRSYQVAISSDMVKMFLQIKIDPSDTRFQLLYWRFNESELIKTYRLTRLVFGLTNSPYTAMRCILQLTADAADLFPVASRVLEKDRFMDDILTGSESVEDGLKLRDQLTEILNHGGFKLTKWHSNIRQIIPDARTSDSEEMVNLGKDGTTKVLGLWWNPLNDTFNYKVQTQFQIDNLTKRSILSSIAKIYDPIGLISPVLVKAKILMQQIWELKSGWDDLVPPTIKDEWLKFINELDYLNGMKIPRKLLPNAGQEVDLAVFCDASQSAYGAAVYARSKNKDDTYSVNLICSKSRVSPLKILTLPRLELCAALLGAKLVDRVLQEVNLKVNKKYYFTDSMIVLHYLNANANSWQVFVANRVAKIQSLSTIADWYHIESAKNPADIISRGAYPKQIDSNLFWKGPDFLSKNTQKWPENRFKPTIEIDQLPEKRKSVFVALAVPEFELLLKYSSLSKLQRVMAYCLRFIYNLRDKRNRRSGVLSNKELNESHNVIIKNVQKREFIREYVSLEKHEPIKKGSKLHSLAPFIDGDGLIRLGGRLRNSSLTFERKFPILLPSKHHVTNLIIRKEHLSLFHAGPTQTLASLRTRYWPLKARGEVRKVIRSCVTCFRVSPRLSEQKMGDLPKDRLVPCRPFRKVGLDYFGPIYIKQGGKRSTNTIKAWVALFVCMVTRAIHLEVVSDLTSECFLSALRRFSSRRGKISHIYCDNAKTFIGAKRQLDEILKFLYDQQTKTDIQSYLSNEGIIWKFIPPQSPNFGGLWERLVKSTKHHLKRVVMNAKLTFEEASTLMTQIEAIVNSRPLTPLSDDPSDFTALTPAHFLIGESLTALPEHNVTEIQETRLSRWERIQKVKQHFWKRWSLEVIPELQSKAKWNQSVPALRIGALVLIADDNLPPMVWRMGRIIKVSPGPDGLVRVATVQTNEGTYVRSIRRLAALPINEERSDK